MVARLPPSSTVARLTLLAVALVSVSGCGSGLRSSTGARASEAPASCAQTVMRALGAVVQRVYREGVESERTASARAMITHSRPLRAAIEAHDPAAARAAAHALIATGHMTNLLITSAGRTMVALGGPALTPLRGTIAGAGGGAPIAAYTTSVWSQSGFSAEASGLAESLVALRAGNRTVGGTVSLPGELAAEGTTTRGGIAYDYTSFPALAYPSGALRAYLLKPASAVSALCGSSTADTEVNTLSHIAHLIYAGEAGARTIPQVRRVQHDPALLGAVARREPQATRRAIIALLNQHIVRLRVSAGHRLLADVGGPYVLAPVSAPLRAGGHTIGSFALSIQDDEGYLRLARRLAGLKVLMYMSTAPGSAPRLVKNSLGAGGHQSLGLSSVPAEGPYTYRGREYRVVTIVAHAFPSGPLTIRVLIPIPYP